MVISFHHHLIRRVRNVDRVIEIPEDFMNTWILEVPRIVFCNQISKLLEIFYSPRPVVEQ